MASTNQKTPRTLVREKTHEGALALKETDALARLRRVLNAHLLWEDTFYVSGQEAAAVLQEAVRDAIAQDPIATALSIVEARKGMNIRHASLMAAVIYARLVPGTVSRSLVFNTIERADELAESLAMNARLSGAAKRMPHALRKGVAEAFSKFDAYQFAKYKGIGDQITLRDAVFLTHPKRSDDLITRIVEGTLAPPDTWEVGLSAGGDKREVFSGLLKQNRLGALALLRNLRNMHEAGVDEGLIRNAFTLARWGKVLPFRFVSAVKAAPMYASLLQDAFAYAKAGQPYLGRANVLIDVSGSMSGPLSLKGTLLRAEAAAALAVCWPGPYRLFVFGTHCREVPAYGRLADIRVTQNHGCAHGTEIANAVQVANRASPDADFTVVVSDMQGAGPRVPAPTGRGVMVNVAPYRNGIDAHGDWTQLSGFSERVYDWLRAEREEVLADRGQD